VALRVDPDHPLPVYEQVRSQVARLSASGQLAAGSRMPTIRQLASDLAVAKGTIERAYLLLESDGVIETRGRAGTFVVEHPPGRDGTDGAIDLSDLHDAAETLAATALQLGATDDVAIRAVQDALSRLR
jgi:DNA-binding transcriptional regulator YhcF (GntR family)